MAAFGGPPGFKSGPMSVRMMLLAGQLQGPGQQHNPSSTPSASSTAPAPTLEADRSLLHPSAPSIEEVLSQGFLGTTPTSLKALQDDIAGEDEAKVETWLRRVSACQQTGGSGQEELKLASKALELASTEGTPTAMKVASHVAVGEAYLNLDSLSKALASAEEALGLAREDKESSAATELLALHLRLKVRCLDLRTQHALEAAREALAIVREVGASAGEVAGLLSASDHRLKQSSEGAASMCARARAAVMVARDGESRWLLLAELLTVVLASMHQEARKDAIAAANEFLKLASSSGACWRQAELLELDKLLHFRDFGSAASDLHRIAAARLAAARAEGQQIREAGSLLLVAQAALEQEDVERALKYAAEALTLFKQLEANESLGYAWTLVAAMHRQANAHEAAFACASTALQTFRTLSHAQGIARAACEVAISARLVPESTTKALALSTTSSSLAKISGDRRCQAFALFHIVKLLSEDSSQSEATLALGAEAGRLFCDVEERLGVAELLVMLSQVNLRLMDTESAVSAAEDALTTLRGMGSRQKRAESLFALARARLADGAPDKALEVAAETLELYRELQDDAAEDEVLLIVLTAHLAQKNFDKVLKLGDRLRRRCQSTTAAANTTPSRDARRREADTLALLAKASLASGAVEDAVPLAREALAIFKGELNDKVKENSMVQLIINAELQSGKSGPTKGLETAKEAAQRFHEEGDRENEAFALQAVAKSHLAKQDHHRAARTAKDAQGILSKLGDTDGEISMLKIAVDAHLARSDADGKEDALQAVVDALTSFRNRDNRQGEAQAMRVLAQVYMARGEPETTMAVVQDTLPLLKELGDRKGEIELLEAVMTADLIEDGTEGSDQALRAVKLALAVCTQLDYRQGMATMLLTTFKILMARAKPERALQAAEEATRLFQDLKNRSGEAQVELLLASLHLSREDTKKALQSAQKAKAIFHELGDVRREEAALMELNRIHSERSDFESALVAGQDALALCKQSGDRRGEARIMLEVCETHLAKSGQDNINAVFKGSREALATLQKVGDRAGEGQAWHCLARAHLAKQDLEEAANNAKEAHRLAVQIGHVDLQASSLATIAEVAQKRGHFVDAAEAATQALDLARSIGSSRTETLALGHLISARLSNAEPSEGLRVAKDAHQRARKSGNARGEAAALQAVANVCIHIRAPVEATQALTGARAIFKKLKDKHKEVEVLATAVNAHMLVGSVHEAQQAVKEAKELSRELKDAKQEAIIWQLSAEIQMECGNVPEAIAELHQAAASQRALGDSLAAAKANQILAMLCLEHGETLESIKAGREAAAAFQAAGDAEAEANCQFNLAKAHMAKHNFAVENLASYQVSPSTLPREDPREAFRAAARARTLYRQIGDSAMELESLHAAANAQLAKQDHREAQRLADEALLLAKKSNDKQAEASCYLLCAQMYAMQARWTPAFRAAESAQTLFEELGNEEGRQASREYRETLQQAAEEAGFYEERRTPQGQLPRGGGRPPGHDKVKGGSTGLYNRKAFPWTKPQASEGA